jgi:hypothetical protein
MRYWFCYKSCARGNNQSDTLEALVSAQGAVTMKRVFVGVAILVVFNLTACGTLTIDGEIIEAAKATPQQIGRFSPIELVEVDKPIEEVILGDEAGSLPAKATGESGITSTPVEDSATTPVSEDTSTPPEHTPAFSSPMPLPSATTDPAATDEIFSKTFWPDPDIPRKTDAEWDFGTRLDFSSSTQTSVSFLAFGMYLDELGTYVSTEACMNSQGQMPSTHPGRPFWSTGIEKTYPAGRHVFEQTYHYYPSLSDDITYMALWLIQRQNGQVVRCFVHQYILLPSTEISVHSQQFFPNASDVIDRNSISDFGVEFRFANSDAFNVTLLAFPIYADEAVPASGTCLEQQGRMPSTHPGRPVWNTEAEEFYPPGLSQTFNQSHRYSEAIPGTTHLVLWLLLRQDGQVHYCAQQAYTLSSEG